MDYMMPEIDGVETTKKIREFGVNTPIIALTARAIDGIEEIMIDAGMNGYLSKPIVNFELNAVISKWLANLTIVEDITPRKIIESAKEDRYASFWEMISNIPGLDLENGLDIFAGNKKLFEKSLRVTARESNKSLAKLNESHIAKDIKSFHVGVHGLRGAFISIGETDISKLAGELENAAEVNDVDFCDKMFPELLHKGTIFNEKLSDALNFLDN
jgi:YesN/AraC family two-component response regulator